MTQYLLPGFGSIEETATGSFLLPGFGVVNESASGASGTTINATVGNVAVVGLNATVTQSGTTTISATVGNVAVAGLTAAVTTYIVAEPAINNTGTVWVSTVFNCSWYPGGRIGALTGITPTEFTATSDAAGNIPTPIPKATGVLFYSKRVTGPLDDNVAYQAFP